MNSNQSVLISSFSQEPYNFQCSFNQDIILPAFSRVSLHSITLSMEVLQTQTNSNLSPLASGSGHLFVCLEGPGIGNTPTSLGPFGVNRNMTGIVLWDSFDTQTDTETYEPHNLAYVSLNNMSEIRLNDLRIVLRVGNGDRYTSDTYLTPTDSPLDGNDNNWSRTYLRLSFDRLPNMSVQTVSNPAQDLVLNSGQAQATRAIEIVNSDK